MTSVSRIPPVVAHDEFDLLASLQLIWQQKRLIGLTAVLFAFLSAVYAFSVTPEYEVTAQLRPAALNDLDALNRSGVYALPPEEALRRVGAALDSYEVRLSYYNASPALQAELESRSSSSGQAFENFNSKALKVIQADPKQGDLLSASIGVEMRYPQGVNGVDALNGLVQYAIESERRQIADDLKVIITNRLTEVDAKLADARADYDAAKASRIAELLESDGLKRAQLQDELKALRAQLKLVREDRIAQLNEAIAIAKTLGLKRPSTPSAMANSDASGNVNRTEVNNQQIPLYFMGTDALEAERQVLRRRESDDFSDPKVANLRKELLLLATNREVEVLRKRQNDEQFLKGIEALRAERARLQGIDADMGRLRLVNIDRPAVTPVDPVKPRKILLVLMGLMVGAVIGIVMAFLRNALIVRHVHRAHEVVSPLPSVAITEAGPSLPLR